MIRKAKNILKIVVKTQTFCTLLLSCLLRSVISNEETKLRGIGKMEKEIDNPECEKETQS